jgi:hypothetical protein
VISRDIGDLMSRDIVRQRSRDSGRRCAVPGCLQAHVGFFT